MSQELYKNNRAFAEKNRYLEKKEKELEKKEAWLKNQIERDQSKLNKLEKELKEKSSLVRKGQPLPETVGESSLKSIKSVEKQLRSREKQLEQQSALAQKQRKEILEKKAELEEREKGIKGKEESLSKREEIIESIDRELSKLKEKVDEKHLRIEESKLSLESKEKELNGLQAFISEREKSFAGMKKSATNELISMRTESERLNDELKTKRELLHGITEQYDGKMRSIKEAEAMMKERELSAIERVKDLEEDEELLNEKETELIQRVADIEEDEKLLEEKENEIVDLMNKFEERKSSEAILAEIKKNKNILSQKESLIIKTIKKLEKAKQGTDFAFRNKAAFEKKIEELKQKELWLMDRERRFDSIMSEEIQKKQLYGAETARMISPAPAAASVQKHDKAISKKLIEEASMPIVPKEDIPEEGTKKVEYLLNVARNYLTTENLEFAKKTLAIAEGEYRKLGQDDENRILEYSIMELKADIDLASLGN